MTARNEREARMFMDTMPTDPELQRWIDAAEAAVARRGVRVQKRYVSPWLSALVVVLIVAFAFAVWP